MRCISVVTPSLEGRFDSCAFAWLRQVVGANAKLLQKLQGHKAGVWSLAWLHSGLTARGQTEPLDPSTTTPKTAYVLAL
jgi:hypothetical protein